MNRGLTGNYAPLPSAAGEKARAFVPNPLPPAPSPEFDTEIQELIQNAMLALGRQDGLTTVLPDPAIFLYSYIRKAAVLASQIKGSRVGVVGKTGGFALSLQRHRTFNIQPPAIGTRHGTPLGVRG